MLRRMKTLGKDTEGATAIEFAFVAPALIWLIFAIIEFGIMMATQSALEGGTSQAARTYKAAARTNANGASAGKIHDLIAKNGRGLIIPSRLRVTATDISWGSSGGLGGSPTKNQGNAGKTGDIIQYRVYYDYPIHTPFLKSVMGDKRGVMNLRASTVVQNEPAIGGGGGI